MDIRNNKLLSGNAGDWFEKIMLANGFDIKNPKLVYVSTAAQVDHRKLLSSKAILLLGDSALRIYKPEVSLGEQRGSPFVLNDSIPVIASYTPQDCNDFKNYEAEFHKLNPDYSGKLSESSEGNEDGDAGKAHGKTKRSNFKFWLTKDIRKIARIYHTGLQVVEPQLDIMPSSDEILQELMANDNLGKYFYLDIETDPATNDITVFSYSFLSKEQFNDTNYIPTIKVVPCRRWNWTRAYDVLPRIFVAVTYTMSRNTTVTHNGSTFDIFIWTMKYKLPFGNSHYDTMNSHHRLFPEVEKSLGHCISLYTDFPYHKNTGGTWSPNNTKQEYQLWKYNGIDVHAMVYVHRGQHNYAKTLLGAVESIEKCNRFVAPLLTMTFTGIALDEVAIQEHISDNETRVNVLLKILWKLCGRTINPNSPKQVIEYLYSSKKDGGLGLIPPSYINTKNPSTDAMAIIKLYVAHPEIASLPVFIDIRRTLKESSALRFERIPW